MKCEDSLAMRETGNAWQRWQAAWHCRRCPRCAAALRAMTQLEDDLVRYEPLPEHLRAAWQRTAPVPGPEFGGEWNRLRFAIVACAAAVGLIAVTAFLWRETNRSDGPAIVRVNPPHEPPPESTVLARTIDASQSLADLLRDVEAFQTEIAAVGQRVSLLDARRQADAMLSTYSQWR
jgi:hypothetical protein